MSSPADATKPERTEEDKERMAKAVCKATGLMLTAVTMCVPTRAPLVLQIKNGDAAATARAMGAMSSAAAALELVVNPVIGKLSDQYGRKLFLKSAPLVSAFLHTLVALFPASFTCQFIDRMISGSMIFGFAAPSQASLADLYASNPAKYGAVAAEASAYFGIGCAVGPFLGASIGGAKSFAASAAAFVGTSIYVETVCEETIGERKQFRFSDINPFLFVKLFKERTLSWLSVTTLLQSWGDYVNIYDINNLFMIKVLGYGQSEIGRFATMVGLTQIAGGKMSKKMIESAGLKPSTLASNAAWVVGMFLMAQARNTKQAFLALAVWTFGHQRNVPVASYLQKYGSAQGMGKGEIIGASNNLGAWFKVVVPLVYSNLFSWATSNGRNVPGAPYLLICVLTALSQFTFQTAAPADGN